MIPWWHDLTFSFFLGRPDHGYVLDVRQVFVPGAEDASAERTKAAAAAVKRFKGQVEAMYATLGPHDLVMVANFPGANEAMQASMALMKLTGIGALPLRPP